MSERLFQRIHPDDPRAVAQRIQFGAEVLGETYTRLQQAEQKALEPWDVDLGECERAILDLNRVDDINEQLPWLIEGALNKIHRAVDHGILPVSHERVDHRLENMIVLVEPGRVGKDGSILYGGYNSSGELIYLLSDTRPGDEEHVLVHEALHQLSGRTYLEIRKNGGSIYKPQRVGLNVIPSLGLRYERLWEYPRNHTPQKNRF